MKRFEFRLDRLLRVKRQKDRQAEARQEGARRVWEVARSEVDLLLEQLVASAEAVEARIGQTLETDRWVARLEHMSQVRAAVDAAEANANRALVALNEANRLRKITAIELESLEHLRAQEWQEHRREAMRVEQLRLDDAFLHRDRRAPLPAFHSHEQSGAHRP